MIAYEKAAQSFQKGFASRGFPLLAKQSLTVALRITVLLGFPLLAKQSR